VGFCGSGIDESESVGVRTGKDCRDANRIMKDCFDDMERVKMNSLLDRTDEYRRVFGQTVKYIGLRYSLVADLQNVLGNLEIKKDRVDPFGILSGRMNLF
jgi:hypothetical protein